MPSKSNFPNLTAGFCFAIVTTTTYGQGSAATNAPRDSSGVSLSAGIATSKPEKSGAVDPLLFQDEKSTIEEPDPWSYVLTPYGFLSGVKGDLKLGGSSEYLDMSFTDILDDYDVIGGSIHFEAWHGPSRWSFITDVKYIGLDGTFDTPDPDIDVNLLFDLFEAQIGAGYRLIDPKTSDLGIKVFDSKLTLDVVGGIRYNYMKIKFDLKPGPSEDSNDHWVHPYIGERIAYKFNDKWAVFGGGNIGYWDSNSNRSTEWNVLMGAEFKPWKNASLKAGYRWQSIYLQSSKGGGFGADLLLQGPMIGATFSW